MFLNRFKLLVVSVRVCVCGRKPAPSFLLAEWMSHSASSLPAHHPAAVPLIDEVRGRRRSEDTGLAAVCVLDGESMLPVNTAAACMRARVQDG